MSGRLKWVLVIVGSLFVAFGLVGLIFLQHQVVEQNRAESERLRGQIADGRALVMTTPDLEREVIVQRETDAVIKEILSEEEEITNFVRTIQEFEVQSGVSITSLNEDKQEARARAKKKTDFEKVIYTLTFDTDAFQFLAFLDAIESHPRFMSVTAFKLSAAKRNQLERGGEPVHNVSLKLETYVYKPKGGGDEVRIDNYDRKRNLLLADISRRGQELRVPVYEYRGPRGRRDPWVDPRVPKMIEGVEVLTIEDQIQIVELLEGMAEEVETLWLDVENADNLIAEMKARAAIEKAIAKLEEEVRRVESSNQIIFAPSVRRLENEVIAVLGDVREKLAGGEIIGPSRDELEEVAESVKRHLDAEEYELALEAYRQMEPRLALALTDESKRSLVEGLHSLAERAQTVMDFEEVEMQIGGVAVMAGVRPVALINGESIVAGEYLDLEGAVFVSDIRAHEIEFVYQGVTLIRRIEDPEYDADTRTTRNTAQAKRTSPKRSTRP